MEQMGYGDQPFVVFKHTDIDRTHIHIVSTSVAIDGKKISDKYDRPHSMKISRELEKKYGLLPTNEKKHDADNKIFRPIDHKAGNIKSQIASVIRHIPKYYRFQSLGEYNALLSLFNITSEEVKGELHGIQKQGLAYFALNENGEKAKAVFKKTIERAIRKAKDEKDFKKQLLDQGINTVVRRTSEGRVYGITFIDHRSKTVWNG